ncbi:MAG: hypothetical protein QM734_07065 [Cyclobacteriaceae bacterium]
MRAILILILTSALWINCLAQSKEEMEVVAEGTKLYKVEMASWYGTDIFLEKLKSRRQNIGGYFSYLVNDKSICVFFSKGDKPKILGTFTFDDTYNVKTAGIDSTERELTTDEFDLMTIRQSALAAYRSDTLFKTYRNTNPNFIPLIDELGKRVYVLTGPKSQGVMIFGNDYLIRFNAKNELKEKRRLHKNIISTEYGNEDGKIAIGGMHTHLPETGDLITATDICTLMLYEKFAKWKQYYVMSKNNVSIWNCSRDQLTVLTKEAWDKMKNDKILKD